MFGLNNVVMPGRILAAMKDAEIKAFNSLARYKLPPPEFV